MRRDSVSDALVLASNAAAEDHRIITFLGAERGVYQAMLFGGRKSRLRALVSPPHSGTVWLYGSAARTGGDSDTGLLKITDFDAKIIRSGIRENLAKTWTAALASEIIIKTNAVGEYASCWTLINAFLDGIDNAEEAAIRPALIRFLWRYLGMMGIRPATARCAHCGVEFARDSVASGTYPAGYDLQEGSFLCRRCADADGNIVDADFNGAGSRSARFSFSPESIAYLNAASHLKPSQSRNLPLSAEAQGELTQFLFYLISSSCGGKLKTLESSVSFFW